MEENFLLDLVSCLEQSKSQKQVNNDLKQLEKTINMLRLTATLAQGSTKKELNAYITQLSNQLSAIKLKAKIDSKNIKQEMNSVLNGIKFKDIDALNIDESKAKLKFRKVIADTKTYAEKTPITINIELKKDKLNNDLTSYLNRNTKISESSILLEEAEKVRELIDTINDKKSLREATDAFQLYKSQVSATGFATKSTADKVKNMLGHITKIGSAFGVASMAVNNFVKSMQTLRSNDTILTEISKTSEMTKQQLKELGDEAFKTASKYGQLSSNYLLSVQEMARSGYEDASNELGELSLLAQSAGDITAENANNYLLATDAAYKYSGSVEKLNMALDGANYISNRNSASLTDIADATRVSASFAANAGIAIDELTAAEATMIATTKRSGSEIGRAFRSIVLNLQQVSGEFDGEVIDEEQLKKVEERCHSLGVELEYMKNGIATLRNPIEVLKDLAEVYNSLPDNSAEKQGLISDLGGKYHANALSALLSRWDLYEKMLSEFSQGAGSALEEAEKTANSWEGRLNSLQNSWDSFINSLTNKEAIMGGISFFDRLIQGAEKLTDTIGEIPVVLTTLNTAMVAMKKDYGITQLINPETKKLDIQGNVLGINFSAIKEQKKHFEEAEQAILHWNDKLSIGKADLDSFNSEVVQNNAQLKNYLSICSKDAPASLSGYKAYLNAAGVSTDALRLKTILLNSAISMGIGVAIQVAVQGITYLIQREENLRQATEEAIDTFESISSEVESLEGKIADLNEQIKELDPITSEEDIENLKLETEELSTQLAILKEKQRIASSDADKAAQKSLGMTEASRYKTEERESVYGGVEIGAAYVTKDEELLNAIEAYEEYKNKVDEANNALADMAETGEYTENEWYEKEQIVSKYSEKMEDARSHANELATTLEEQKQGLNGNTESSQALLGTIDNAITKYDEWLNAINGTTEALEEQSEAEEKVSESAKEVTFDQAWADSFTSENDAVKELGNNLLELAEQGRLTIETFNNADSTGYFKDLGISADEAVSKINKLVDESKQLSSMSGQISSMAEALGAKLENGFVNADTLSGFDVEVRGLDSWDRFQEVLGSTASSYEECQEAANALATEWVNSSDFLAQLTEQNKEYYKTQLQAMGIENYEEVIAYAQALNEAKEVLSQSSLMLGEATQDEIEALIAEGQYSELTANMILALYDAKIAEQAATIDTSADCANLIALAGDTDRTSQSIQLLIQLMDIYSGLESGAYDGNRLLREEALGEVNRIKGELEKLANGENEKLEIEPTVKLGNRGKSSAKSAGKEAGDAYKDGLKEELSDLESIISSLSKSIDGQKEVISSQKEVALEAIESQIDALEEERDARLAVIEAEKAQLETQIKAIDKQIDAKQKEIDAINDAVKAKEHEIALQKAQYELERMQNQRTILQYSEDKGMHYVADTSKIRDAKEGVDDAKRQLEVDAIEREIDLLQEKKDLLNEQINILDEQTDSINNFYDSQIKALEKQKENTEKYFEMLTKSLDSSKDKYQELLDIVDKAELSGRLKKLGIDEEALLNGSEEEFQKLKDAYMGIVFQLNEGNEEVLSSLRELSGYDGTAPSVLSDSNSELDTMNSSLDTSSQNIESVNTSLADTSTQTNDVAANIGDLETNLSNVNTLVTDEQTAFDNLKLKIDEVIEAIEQKTLAIQEEQNAAGIATSSEMADFILLKDKILEVKESLDTIDDSVGIIDTTPINNLSNAFQLLYDKLLLVSTVLGAGMEGQEEGAVSGISSAIEALNEISLEEGIIAQFDNLKTAIDSVTSAISGGGSESSDGEGQGGSGSKSKGGESGGKGSEGAGGGNSLTGAITEMGETASEVIGSPDAEGDGTVIGEFGSLKTAVNDAATAIGGGESEGSKGQGEGSGGEGNLIDSIINLGEQTEEVLGEPGGEGAIGRFEKFKEPIIEADEHVQGISDGLDEINGKEVECTIKLNIESNGSVPAYASGTALGAMDLNSAEYNAKYSGNAHVAGTANVTGNWGVRKPGKSLVGELGQEIWVHSTDGTFETVGDNGPEWINTEKGDLIFNHLQTKELLDKGNIVKKGKAYADGTVQYSDGTIVRPDGVTLRPLQPGDRAYELQKAFEPLLKKIQEGGEAISNAYFEHQKQMEKWTKEITNNTAINNITNNRNVQPVVHQQFNISLPNVTNSTTAESLMNDLQSIATKKYQIDW